VDTKRRNPDLGGMTEMAEREEAEGDLSGGGDFFIDTYLVHGDDFNNEGPRWPTMTTAAARTRRQAPQ
jgi:hypothetical protein